MSNIKFHQLPGVVHFSVFMAFFTAWNLFERHVINHWLHPYMPGYVVGAPCVWDLGMAILIAGLIFACRRKRCFSSGCDSV